MVKDRATVTIEELVTSEMIQTEALTRLLIGKGIILKEELIEEVRQVNLEMQARGDAEAGKR